jgi:hypothetical protein
MTGGQEDEEAMNKEHQFWIKERDIYSARLDEEKRYGCVTMNLSSTQPADKLLVYDGNWDTSQNRILSLLQSSESRTRCYKLRLAAFLKWRRRLTITTIGLPLLKLRQVP